MHFFSILGILDLAHRKSLVQANLHCIVPEKIDLLSLYSTFTLIAYKLGMIYICSQSMLCDRKQFTLYERRLSGGCRQWSEKYIFLIVIFYS